MRARFIGSLLLLSLAGCAAPQLAGVPLGHWSGTGEFIAVASGDAATKPAVPEIRRYQTTLDIRPGTGTSRGRLVFEIQSARGEIAGLEGDRTHLIFELVPTLARDGQRVRTYAIARAGVSGDAAPPALDEGPQGAVSATGFRDNSELVLQVSYQSGECYDVFHFRGDRLTKSGALLTGQQKHFDHDIYWSEELIRR